MWLRPRSNWRTRYAGWPALKKLEYVDELMAEIAGKRPTLTHREKVDPLEQAHRDARRLLQEKAGALRRRYAENLRPRSAAAVLRRSKASPLGSGFVLHQAQPRPGARAGRQMDRRISAHLRCRARRHDPRCRELNLRAVGPERKLIMEFTVLLTAKTMHALFGPSRRRWIAL